ncbi:flagellar protein FlaG [Lysinibacillus sp. SGAir0095]|uniref:flagellar protein FlaG n=1 Tax=Lysinibacillus sp. SGAir0095 TaxID=2070463 RepID=UPI0010CCEFE9|nr:flagellar protein FlaG [Lysinibacillus sp. SGAir0095]QCR31525.1 flagellar biosynthesis protein FlaG [Lysinibacillus sp. SGAir0095]
MRISQQQAADSSMTTKTYKSTTIEKVEEQGSLNSTNMINQQLATNEKNDVNEEKLKQAVESLNEFLEINHNSSKFVYHEGLDRYFVQVVNKDTEEVVKEIPPKKLLDAFYEMQKMVGMIVDEKI